MPKTKRKYAVNSLQQLIDLNQDLTNFHLKFTCESEDPTDTFELLVVNQSQLDDPNSKNLKYKQVQGSISGEVTADKNVYQNYFLIMKAPKECNIAVTSNIVEIPPKKKDSPSPNHPSPQHPSPQHPSPHHPSPHNQKSDKSVLNSSVFLWIVVGIVALVLIYFIFWPKNEKKTVENHPPLKDLIAPKSVSKTPPLLITKKKRKKKKKIYDFNDLEV